MSNALTAAFNPLMALSKTDGNEEYVAELLRNQVSQIIGSYHHQFDHLYESIQNAVDACEKTLDAYEQKNQDYLPEVQVVIDLDQNKLVVIDNGVGMSKEELTQFFFTPNATLKGGFDASRGRQRGEKGVGATFTAYGTNSIHISTKKLSTDETTSGRLECGLDWVNKDIKTIPMPQVTPAEPHTELANMNHGSAVTIEFSDKTNMGSLSDHGVNLKQWEIILRLHTALGLVSLGDNDELKDVLTGKLTLIEDGKSTSKRVRIGYFFPHEVTESRIQLSSLDRSTKKQLPDSQRDMNILYEVFSHEKVREHVQKRMGNTSYMRAKSKERISRILNVHSPKAYVGFTYSSDYWDEATNKYWQEDPDGMFSHGIVFATKGQKIGEQKKIDFKFRSGDFNRFFILLEMDELKSDIGRKSFREEIEEFAQFFANSIQSLFNENDDCLTPNSGQFDEAQDRELEDIRDRGYELPDLGLPGTNFVKVPKEEQDVIALFFNLLGSGNLKGFKFYSTHISRKYDGVGAFELSESKETVYDAENNVLGIAPDRFKNKRVESPRKNFIEFKFNSDSLVADVRSGRKRLQDMRWLICWEIGQNHVPQGIGITEILEPAQINKRDYYGVTHIMTEGQSKVHVICLKNVIDVLAGTQQDPSDF